MQSRQHLTLLSLQSPRTDGHCSNHYPRPPPSGQKLPFYTQGAHSGSCPGTTVITEGVSKGRVQVQLPLHQQCGSLHLTPGNCTSLGLHPEGSSLALPGTSYSFSFGLCPSLTLPPPTPPFCFLLLCGINTMFSIYDLTLCLFSTHEDEF